jgi:hypothetical protein
MEKLKSLKVVYRRLSTVHNMVCKWEITVWRFKFNVSVIKIFANL